MASILFANVYSYDPVCRTLAYKRVAQKVQPIPTVMPDYAKVIRRFPEDPLASLPPLSTHPPSFEPGLRLTKERLDGLGI
ncbi:hypothetical protein FB446DRAFT_656159, partial [Lentinula raphanica]